MAYELVETSRLWARTLAPVTAQQIERAAGDLVTRTLSEPTFSPRSATVVASETVSLFGVPIISGRRTNYAASHPEQAREIFIRSGLVEGEWQTRTPVVVANRFALEEAERLTDRMRRPELLISDAALYDFYDRVLPESVVSGATFDKYVRGLDSDAGLRLTPADCMTDPGLVRVQDFPDRWRVGELELPVSYVYDPGTGADGVTVEVRLEQLGAVESAPFTWQVPGLRESLAVALIRSLPKRIRTSFVPAPDHARRALTWLGEHGVGTDVPFPRAMGQALQAITGVRIAPEDWNTASLDAHLRPTFVVVDGREEVARGEDLRDLKVRLSAKVAGTLTRRAGRLAATGATSWVFGSLPRTTELGGGAVGHPCLVDEDDVSGDGLVDGGTVGQGLRDDLLVGADRIQRVGAGQVLDHDVDIAQFVAPLEAGDGHPRVVPGLGAQPGEGVEQGGLAAVGAADQHEPTQRRIEQAGGGGVVVAGHRVTWILAASLRRSTISVPSTLNMRGSPSGARRSSSQVRPGAKPRSKSRRLMTSSPSNPTMVALAPIVSPARVPSWSGVWLMPES